MTKVNNSLISGVVLAFAAFGLSVAPAMARTPCEACLSRVTTPGALSYYADKNCNHNLIKGVYANLGTDYGNPINDTWVYQALGNPTCAAESAIKVDLETICQQELNAEPPSNVCINIVRNDIDACYNDVLQPPQTAGRAEVMMACGTYK